MSRKDCPVEHVTLHFVAFKPAVFEVANVVLDLCCPWCGGQLENLEGMYDGQDAARLLSTAGKVAPWIKPPGPTQRRKD